MKQTKDIHRKNPFDGLSRYRIVPVLITLAAAVLFAACTFVENSGDTFDYYLRGTWKTASSNRYKITIEISYNTIMISNEGSSTPALLNGITWNIHQNGCSDGISTGTNLKEGTIYFNDIGLGEQKSISYRYGKETYPGTEIYLILDDPSSSGDLLLYKSGSASTFNYFDYYLQGTWKTASADQYQITLEITHNTIWMSNVGSIFIPSLLSDIAWNATQDGYSYEASSSTNWNEGIIYIDNISTGKQKSISYRYWKETNGTQTGLTLGGNGNNLIFYKQ